jgi:hypothetical protein
MIARPYANLAPERFRRAFGTMLIALAIILGGFAYVLASSGGGS